MRSDVRADAETTSTTCGREIVCARRHCSPAANTCHTKLFLITGRMYLSCSRRVIVLWCFPASTQLLSYQSMAPFRDTKWQTDIYSMGRKKWHFCRAMLCISAAYAVMRFCLSVHLSVTFVHCVKLSNHPQTFSPSGFSVPNIMAIFRRGPSNRGCECRGYKNRDFRPVSRFISETVQYRAIVTIERQ